MCRRLCPPHLQGSGSRTPGNGLKPAWLLQRRSSVSTQFLAVKEKKSWLFLMFHAPHLPGQSSASNETITALSLASPSAGFCCPWSTSSSKFGGMLLLTLNVTVILEEKRRSAGSLANPRLQQGSANRPVRQPYFSPETFLESLASVPFISSSHPPDILGRLLFFWSFLSSLISSVRKSLNALSPVI